MKNRRIILIAIFPIAIILAILVVIFQQAYILFTHENKISAPYAISTILSTPPPKPYGILWTPIATLPSSSADPTITALYQGNNCRLSCWQGITPGEISWNDAWKILGKLAKNVNPGQM
jgi:hypothetical protein